MYESYDYNSNNERKPTLEEIKAKEKELKAEQAARKKAEKAEKKAAKKAARKARGTGKKIFGTLALACVFGVTASVVFQATNKVTSKYFGTNEPEKTVAVNETPDEKVTLDNQKTEEKKDSTDSVVKTEKNVDVQETLTKPILDNSDNAGKYSVSDVAEEVMPSIVAITNKSVQEVMSWYGMGIQQYESESAGSGIIIGQSDTELLIATNAHVVQGAQTLTVCFIDESVLPATIKGSDVSNDLAVIAVSLNDVDGSTLNAIKVATIGDSEALRIGEQVVAIGNALGYGQSVTTGIVSALDRDITDDDVDNSYIQTDAAINPGNSGGALLNMRGELVGINSAKLASAKIEGMGYAIPISAAKPIMEDLMNRASRSKVDPKNAGYVGISGFSVTSEVSVQYGIPEGIYVSETTSGAAADRAGLQKGDIITAFDGINVDSISKLRERLDYYSAGETVDITIYRADNGEYKEMTFKIVLDGREGTPLDESAQPDAGANESEGVDKNRKQEGNQKQGQNPSGNFRDYYSQDDDLRSIFDFFGY